MNSFAELLQKLTDQDAQTCLQAVCLGHGGNLADLERAAQAGSVQAHLQRLVALDLVVFQNNRWQPTWSGRGVYHWIQQLLWADAQLPAPEPRPEENGDQLVAGCNNYRPLYCRPGYCWCGLLRSDHASEAPKTAAKYLAHERERKRRERLWNQPSGRSILELHRQLDQDQLAALDRVHDQRADGLTAAELGKALRPGLESGGRLLSRVDHQVGEQLLQQLADLDLVLAVKGGIWHPTFDGAGVANWNAQLLHPGPHPQPQPGENGSSIAVHPCERYRAFFPEPGYCWCGHHQAGHPA